MAEQQEKTFSSPYSECQEDNYCLACDKFKLAGYRCACHFDTEESYERYLQNRLSLTDGYEGYRASTRCEEKLNQELFNGNSSLTLSELRTRALRQESSLENDKWMEEDIEERREMTRRRQEHFGVQPGTLYVNEFKVLGWDA